MTDRPRTPRAAALSLPKKLAFAAVTVGAVFGLVELALWAGGATPLIAREDPFRGFSGLVSVFERDGDVYRTARVQGQRTFNAQTFLADKPDDGLRLFTLGGSSAYGFPMGAEAAFTAVLGEVLAEAYPRRTVEAVNAAGVSYAMHRLRYVAREVVGYEPDFLVVYSGHNEFVEPTFFEELKRRGASRTRIEHALAHSRLYSVLRSTVDVARREPETAADRFGMVVRREHENAFTPDDKREVIDAFREGLREIVRLAHERGTKVVVATVPANLREWPPNHSLAGELEPEASRRWVAALAEGRARLAAGDAPAAAASFEAALGLAPDHAESHFLAAKAYEALGRWDDARDAYDRACDLDASPIRRLSGVNDAVRQVAREEGALLVDVELAFRERSEHGLVGFDLIEDYVHPTREAHELIAWLVWEAMESAGWLPGGVASRDLFARVVDRRRPEAGAESATWYFNQGYLLEHQGRAGEALARYREAVRLDPSHTAALSNLARLLVEEEREDEALPLLDRLLRIDPDHPEGRVIYGNALRLQGRTDEAAEQYRRAAGSAAEDVTARLSLGQLLLERGDLAGARAEFERALALAPSHPDARLGLAAVVERTDGAAAALPLYREIVREHPSSARGRLLLGIAIGAAGDRAAAIAALEEAAGLDPSSPAAPFEIGRLHVESGALDQASGSLRTALERDPDHVPSLNLAALVAGRLRRVDEALVHLSRIVEIEPGSPEAHNNHGVVLRHTGRMSEAIESFQTAVALDDGFAKAHSNLAAALATAGRWDEALRHAERAAALDPQDRVAAARLASIRGRRVPPA
jgi:tetratricopeptide (TPR) repeat protein